MSFAVSKTSQSQAQYPSTPLRKTCARLESLPCRIVWRFGTQLHTESTWRFGTTPGRNALHSTPSFRRGNCASAPQCRGTVIPLIPAAPLLLTTCSYALSMFSRTTTASINCVVYGLTGSFLAASLDAPFPYSRDFRPLPSGRDSGISAILSASPRVAKFKRQSFLRVRAFVPVAETTMPSADFCHPITPPLDGASTR